MPVTHMDATTAPEDGDPPPESWENHRKIEGKCQCLSSDTLINFKKNINENGVG
jgi:hypothetical protein